MTQQVALADRPKERTHSSFTRFAANAISVLTSDAITRATTFAIYALVGRFLGPYEFGQMSLALTFFYIGQVGAIAGMRSLLTRELAKAPSQAALYLVNGSALATGCSVLSVVAIVVCVLGLGYSGDTEAIILLLSLGLLPYSLGVVCESIFQAHERMGFIALATVPVNVGKLVVALALLATGHGLVALLILLLAGYTVTTLIEWVFVLRLIGRHKAVVHPRLVRRLARSTMPFLGVEGFVALMSSSNILLLSKLAGEREVGLYTAASQVLVPMTLICTSVVQAAFPTMCRAFVNGSQNMAVIVRKLVGLLISIAFPMALEISFLATSVLLLLYHDPAFSSGAATLKVIACTLVLQAPTAVLGQALYAELHERTNLRITALDATAGIVLGVVLITHFGLVGAAVATVATKLLDFVLHYASVRRILPSLSLASALWKPGLAGLHVAALLTFTQSAMPAFSLAIGVVVFAFVLVELEIITSRGSRVWWACHQQWWPE